MRQAIGDESAAQAGGGFRPQGDRFTAAIVKGVHFLGDDIRGFAKGARKNAGIFEDRHDPLVETVTGGDPAGGFGDMVMAALIFANQVVRAAGGLEIGHERPC